MSIYTVSQSTNGASMETLVLYNWKYQVWRRRTCNKTADNRSVFKVNVWLMNMNLWFWTSIPSITSRILLRPTLLQRPLLIPIFKLCRQPPDLHLLWSLPERYNCVSLCLIQLLILCLPNHCCPMFYTEVLHVQCILMQ